MDTQGKARVALTFALYQGEKLLRRETIEQDIVKVGKDPRSHLRVDDEAASRMHAVIEVVSPTDVTVIDLGNEPGTLVNGQRVNKCKLRASDQIQIAGTLIVLESAEGGGATAPAAAAPPVATAASNPFAGVNPFATAGPVGANPFASSNPFGDATAEEPAAAFVAQAAPLVPTPGLGIEPPVDGDLTGFTYSMVKSGPDVVPDDVEVAHAAAIEVMILWDSNVLHVSHLAPPRSFAVGEEMGEKEGVDYFIPGETLGAARAPIVASRGLGAALVILPRSRGYVDVPGQGKVSFADLISSGRARLSAEMGGAHEYELPAGAKARMELDGSALVFQVSAVNAGKRLPGGLLATMEPAAFLFTGLSFVFHLGLVAVFAFFMPNMSGDDSEAIDRDQIMMMQKLLNAEADREKEEEKNKETDPNPTKDEGGTGDRSKGEEGKMGNQNSKEANNKYGVKGPQNNPDTHLAKQAAIDEARTFGMIGLLSSMSGGDPNAPTAPWGRDDSSGVDEKSARGNMFGDTIGDAFGTGGLGLTGTGEGGGGRGESIGLGNFGGLGHGAGTGTGQGIGGGRGGIGGVHKPKAPSMREGVTSVNGRLPPEVIQRIVRQNFGRFRLCYENGMRQNPNLQGRVAVKFVIDRSGAVSLTTDGGSDLLRVPRRGEGRAPTGRRRARTLGAQAGGAHAAANLPYSLHFSRTARLAPRLLYPYPGGGPSTGPE